MPIKNAIYTFSGTNQDLSRSKHLPQYYFDAQHIKLLSTDSQSTGSVANEKGNEEVIFIPNITINRSNKTINYNNSNIFYTNSELEEEIQSDTSGNQIIIGHSETREGIILFTTNNDGFDCIWVIRNVLNSQYNIELLYIRNLGFSTNNPIQSIFNYENDNIQKVYWVDNNNQIRFLNIQHSILNGDEEELIDLSSTTINFVGNFNLNQPVISSISSGGIHTSGMIQYAYNLYRLNSSQTVISPLTELISLDKGSFNGGGEVNEIVGAIPVININNIDTNYTNIRLYAIKYTNINELPQISLILDSSIDEDSITYYDDGSVINNLSLEEFRFLGSNPIIPRHIEAKDNRLLLSDIKEKNFNVDIDTRAYSFAQADTSAFVYNNVKLEGNAIVGDLSLVNPNNYNLPLDHDAINLNYDIRRFQPNSNIVGGEGKFLKYELLQQTLDDNEARNSKFFKDNEIYRIAIQFYNRLGQKSFTNWIADFKASQGNLNGNYNTLKVELKPEFYVWLNTSSNFESEDDKPVGYKLLVAERNLKDRSILYQGILSPYIFQLKGEEAQTDNFPIDITDIQDENLKMPSYFIRNFENTMAIGPENGAANGRGEIVRNNHGSRLNAVEIHSQGQNDNKSSQTFQFTKMMQFYSPEVEFDFVSTRENLQVRVNGASKRTAEFIQTSEISIITEQERHGGKFQFFPTRQFIENNQMNNTFNTPGGSNPRYIGPTGDVETVDFLQTYREYNDFVYSNNNTLHYIYGSPEITNRGQGRINYNGDARYAYSNSLQSWLSDGEVGNGQPILTSFNSWGSKNLTIMLGDRETETTNRIGIENLFNSNPGLPTDSVLNVDITIPKNNIYINNLYGGNTYESKLRTIYLEIGKYESIDNNSVIINSPGDTFVNNFIFLRLSKTDTEILSTRVPQVSEIVSFKVETTVDIKNRSDLSLFNWDNRFQPRDDEFHIYNTVYSQRNNLITGFSIPNNFRELNSFDTRIQATRLKIPNETIDSWTDILVNEVIDLDGVYGPINGLKIYKDRLFAFQDKAIASISVNPRIQVQGSDGIGIELGRGSVLYDYDYITTKSGSINKWSLLETKKGIYYYDALNKAIGRVPDSNNILLTDIKGMHSWFNNNYNFNSIQRDNPIIKSGVVFGYDNFNNDVYFTFHLNNPFLPNTNNQDLSFTRCYNELQEEFIDLKTYLPSFYINQGEKFLLTNSENDKLYEHYLGEYNKYFDEYQNSNIVLMINPESNIDCVFNNIMYKSELYINDIDQPNKTLTGIQAYNEYQDSGLVPLKLSRNLNLRRKFRDWKANIPRDSRDRIRNPWMFLKLELDNKDNQKLILHDIVVYYTTY